MRVGNGLIQISLRGSLAEKVLSLEPAAAEVCIKSLLEVDDPLVTKFFEDGSLVIGLTNERGSLYPDW